MAINRNKKKNNKIKIKSIIITSAISIIIIAAIVAVILFSRDNSVPDNPSGTIGNSSGNLYNGGLFCEYNDKIYFNNSFDNHYLYSMNADGSNVELIAKVPAKFICCAGNYIYYYHDEKVKDKYLGLTGSPAGIYRISAKNHRKTLNLDRTASLGMNVIDSKVYYLRNDIQKGLSFYSCDLDGKNRTQISEDQVFPNSVRNGKIYYSDNMGDCTLHEFSTSSLGSRAYISERCYQPIISDNVVYYINIDDNYALYSYSFADDTIKKLCKDRVDAFNVYQNVIFYQRNSKTNPCLIRMATDGSNAEIVEEGNFCNINCTSSYTYFQPFDDLVTTFKTPTTGSISVTPFRLIVEN